MSVNLGWKRILGCCVMEVMSCLVAGKVRQGNANISHGLVGNVLNLKSGRLISNVKV
jgi:hypothetical protein